MLHLSGNHWLGCVWHEKLRFLWCRGGGLLFFFRLAVKIDSLPDPNNLWYGSAAFAEKLRDRSPRFSTLLGALLADKRDGLEQKRTLPKMAPVPRHIPIISPGSLYLLAAVH